MTIVGKILVFIILVFSLVVGGLAVVVFIARTNFAEELKKSNDLRKIEVAQRDAYRTQVEDVRIEKDGKIAELTAALKRSQDELAAQQRVNSTLSEKLAAEEQKNARSDAVIAAGKTEVERRQKDVEQMRATLKDEVEKGIILAKDNAKLKEERTAATIQRDSFRDMNARLEHQLQEMAKDMARIRANMGAATTTVQAGKKNPPAEQVEGLIKAADANGLVKISLGSDAGLTRGHTLEVFRLNRVNPQLSKYLGTIQILEVSATEAVGTPMGKMVMPPQTGDHVASRILGS